MALRVTKCMNTKFKTEKIRYDKDEHILYCDSCRFKWKVKPYTPQRPCPECGSNDIIYTEDETYCNNCKLILSSSSDYVAGNHIDLPWGLLL